ncbi:hypothetical protein [Brachybacterium phenoliresistens]|uniref:hypothetical protein n=1 Tax=Brachybacterium phenoliresistens TaxID=396014 RepID=UPI0031E44391
MGLIHATSLERWEEWERTRHRGRLLKHTLTGALRRQRGDDGAASGPRYVLRSRGGEGPRLLIAVDSATPTSRASLLTALPYLRGAVDVLAPVGVDLPETAGAGWSGSAPAGMDVEEAARALPGRGITAVVSLGQHLGAGRIAHEHAAASGTAAFVVQHGALTPFAPPLPPETTLLSWSDADGEFWRSGREDITVRTIGSQLLWQARHEAGLAGAGTTGAGAAQPAPEADPQARPVFLGQLHGAELPRRVTGGAAYTFCRLHDGLYRPHPSETDKLSRATHEVWRRRGVEFAPADVPLREVTSPVVAVFSTGVLEAAARGVPSYVFAPKAPDWVAELWDRYGMRRFGAPRPTPSPLLPSAEPAAALAEILDGAA